MGIASETSALLGLFLQGSVTQVELGDTGTHTAATGMDQIQVWPYSFFSLEDHYREESNPTPGWKVNVGERSSPPHCLGGQDNKFLALFPLQPEENASREMGTQERATGRNQISFSFEVSL